MPTRHGHMIKQPAEELDRAVDFSERLANVDAITVESVEAYEVTNQTAFDSLEPDEVELDDEDVTDELIAADPAPSVPEDTKHIQFRVIGGEAGKRYKIEVQARGDDDQVAEYDLYVDVKD